MASYPFSFFILHLHRQDVPQTMGELIPSLPLNCWFNIKHVNQRLASVSYKSTLPEMLFGVEMTMF